MAKAASQSRTGGSDGAHGYASDDVFAHLHARARLARGDATPADRALATQFRDRSDQALRTHNQAVFAQIGPTPDEQDIADWIEAAATDLNDARPR